MSRTGRRLNGETQKGKGAEGEKVSDWKETEFGLIPADWEVMPLDKVATFTRKPRSLDLSQFDEVPFVPMAQIPESGNSIEGYELRAGDDISSGTYCEKGNILLAKITPSFENGKQVILEGIPLDFACATTEVYAFDAKPDLADQMFLFYYFRLPSVRADLAGRMEGSTGRQRIRKDTIAGYPIIIPPLPEQRRIASALRIIQEAIAAQKDIIDAAREFKRSLLERLFTYGPGPQPAPTKEIEIGEIPEHWATELLGQMSNVVRGASPRPKGDPKYFSESGPVHWIMISDLSKHKTGKLLMNTEEFLTQAGKEKSRYLERGTLVLTNSGTVGKPAILGIDGCIHDGYLAFLDLDESRIQKEYLYYYFRFVRPHLVRIAPRGTQANLNTTIAKSLLTPVPPREEQRQIVETLSAADKEIEAEEQRKTALEELFRSALEQLMTGQTRLA